MKNFLLLCLSVLLLLVFLGCSAAPPLAITREKFLEFLLDEFPLAGQNQDEFLIFDLDGDGEDEFFYFHSAFCYVFRYNKDKKGFEPWLTTRRRQLPAGNSQMYEIASSGSFTAYSYLKYDTNAKLIDEINYTVLHDGPDISYWTDFGKAAEKEITEEEWHAASAWLFELIEHAPKPISYQE